MDIEIDGWSTHCYCENTCAFRLDANLLFLSQREKTQNRTGLIKNNFSFPHIPVRLFFSDPYPPPPSTDSSCRVCY